MSYLLQHARPRRSNARVDERARLNLPGFYGDAYVRVFVEDTPLFVPDIRDHIALYRLFGRPKDLARVEQLERLIA